MSDLQNGAVEDDGIFSERGFLFKRTLTKYTLQRIDEAVDVTPLIAIPDALAVPFSRASAAAPGAAASHTARTSAAPSTPLRDITSAPPPLALLR